MFHRALDLVFACFVALVILWFVWEARDWSFHSRLFPWSVGITVLILALAQVALSVRNFQFGSSKDNVELKVRAQDHQAAEVEPSEVWRLVTIGRLDRSVFLGNLAVRVPLGKSDSYNRFFKSRRQGRL